MTSRTLLLRMILVGVLAAVPASAAGAVRHAAENGGGTACTAAAPCQLAQALTGAGNGVDEVRVHAGTHQLPTGGGGAGGRFAIAGAPGEAMPTIETQAPVNGCGLSVGAGSTVRRLRIRPIATGSRALCSYGQTVIDRIVITGTGAGSTLVNAGDLDLETDDRDVDGDPACSAASSTSAPTSSATRRRDRPPPSPT